MAKRTPTPPTSKPLTDIAYDKSKLVAIPDTYQGFCGGMDKIQALVGKNALELVLAIICVGKTIVSGLNSTIDCLNANYNGDHQKWFLEYQRERGYSVKDTSIANLKSRFLATTISFHVFPRILNTLQTLRLDGDGMTNYYYFASIIASKKARASRKYDNLIPLWEKMVLIPLSLDVTTYQKTLDTIYGKKKVERAKASKAKPANTAGNPNFGDENSSVSVKTPEKAMVAASTIEPGNPEINGSNPETLAKANALMLSLNFADRCKVIGHVMTPAELVKLVLACVDKVDNNALEDIKRKVLGLTAKHPVSIPSQAAQASPAPSAPAVN